MPHLTYRISGAKVKAASMLVVTSQRQFENGDLHSCVGTIQFSKLGIGRGKSPVNRLRDDHQ